MWRSHTYCSDRVPKHLGISKCKALITVKDASGPVVGSMVSVSLRVPVARDGGGQHKGRL